MWKGGKGGWGRREDGVAVDGIVDRFSFLRVDLLLPVTTGRYCAGCGSNLRPAATSSELGVRLSDTARHQASARDHEISLNI